MVNKGIHTYTPVDERGRVCMLCLTYKPWSEYYQRKVPSHAPIYNRFLPRCKECVKAQQRARNRDYREEVRRLRELAAR